MNSPAARQQRQAQLRERVERRVGDLPARLQAHISRARNIARELAICHGLEPERAELGILAHDVARAMPGSELMEQALRLSLPVGLVERQVPLLLHGPVGAEVLRRNDGLAASGEDGDLYQAVYWHTTAHPTLDSLGKVVFLADKLDPNKRKRYPYQPRILELAREDLDKAMLELLTRQIVDLAQRGLLVHSMMLEARNSLLTEISRAAERG